MVCLTPTESLAKEIYYWLECLLMGRVTRVQFHIELNQWLKNWYLMSPYLNLTKIRLMCSNPGNGIWSSPRSRCSCYWKVSLRVELVYGHHLYYFNHSNNKNDNKNNYKNKLKINGSLEEAKRWPLKRLNESWLCVFREENRVSRNYL